MMKDEVPERIGAIRQTKKRAFLLSYADTFNVSESARRISIDRQTHYNWLEADPEYAAAFDEASKIGAESLEAELVRRAKTGVRRYKFHQGEPIMVRCAEDHPDAVNLSEGTDERPVWAYHYYETEYSDTLGIFLMKGAKPDKYRERVDVRNVDEDKLNRHIEHLQKRMEVMVRERAAAIRGSDGRNDRPNGNGHPAS